MLLLQGKFPKRRDSVSCIARRSEPQIHQTPLHVSKEGYGSVILPRLYEGLVTNRATLENARGATALPPLHSLRLSLPFSPSPFRRVCVERRHLATTALRETSLFVPPPRELRSVQAETKPEVVRMHLLGWGRLGG